MKDPASVCEQIQDDLICILEEIVSDEMLTNVCQVVVDRFDQAKENINV